MWASTVGDESYKFESVLPLYEKSVEFTPPNSGKIGPGAELIKYTDAPRGGPLQVSFPNYLYPISKPFYDAFKALGLAAIPGFNNGSLIGTACFTCTIDPAQEIRSSSESSFLQSALRSPNLKIYHNTVANKILLENRAAYAVNVTTAGISYVLSADKEVILSAGAVSYAYVDYDSIHSNDHIVQVTTATHAVRHRTKGNAELIRHPTCC